MKVLIISSSPRKGGNSDVLCDQFAKGAVEAGHEVEKVNLREKRLSPCRACYACMENHVCAIQDDMAEIFPKLVAADVIVLASPVYFYSVCSQMKMLLDRCLVNHKAIANKQLIDSHSCDGIHHIHAVDDFSECCIRAIQVGSILVHDKELAACGIRMHGTSHGNHTFRMLQIIGHTILSKFALDGISGTSHTSTFRIDPSRHTR